MQDASPRKPRIGVTWIGSSPSTDGRYVAAVRTAGGEPVPLSSTAESWAGDLALLHGLLFTGGGDIDPACYGQKNDCGLSEHVEPRRDALELDALRFCLEQGLPVLGICRGFQLINVALGGSLLQDIEQEANSPIQHSSVKDAALRPSRHHPILVLPGTRLVSILGSAGEHQVNSRHHQGLMREQAAPGLRVSAVAPDGIVEGLETEEGRFLVAVQCHPERAREVHREFHALFAALVSEARRPR